MARSERLFLHLPDRLAAIKEMMRVVKTGGRVCLLDTDTDCTAVYSESPALMRKMTSLVAASMPNPNSARELHAFAREAGLKDLKTEVHAIYTPYEFSLRSMAGSLIRAAEDGIVPRAEVEECLGEHDTVETMEKHYAPFVKELRDRVRNLMENGEGLSKTRRTFFARSDSGPKQIQ